MSLTKYSFYLFNDIITGGGATERSGAVIDSLDTVFCSGGFIDSLDGFLDFESITERF